MLFNLVTVNLYQLTRKRIKTFLQIACLITCDTVFSELKPTHLGKITQLFISKVRVMAPAEILLHELGIHQNSGLRKIIYALMAKYEPRF